MRFFGSLFVLALAACAPQTDILEPSGADGAVESIESEGSTALPEQCDAADYRVLVGTPVAAAALVSGAMLRIYGEGDIVTQDYIPQRTNVIYDGAGVIRRVTCG